MRIAFLAGRWVPARPGGSSNRAGLAQLLSAAGRPVYIFTDRNDWPESAVPVRIVRTRRRQAVADAADELEIDIVVGWERGQQGMHVFRPFGGTVAGTRRQKLARTRNPLLRLIWRVLWAILPAHRRAAASERRQFAGPGAAAHFLPLSNLVRDDMRTFYGVPPERLHVVHHGIDAQEFSPERCAPLREQARRSWGLSDGTVCFLFVGNAFRRKGVPELLRAAALLRRRRSDFRVLIVGRPERNRFWFGRLRARLAGCADVVEFAGPVVPVQRAYAAADAFILPSWYDTFGLVLLEAMACGLPVIATRQCGAADLIADGREGFVVDTPADTAALAERMERLMDPAARVPMGRAARQTALEHTCEREFRDLLAVLERAAAERRAGLGCRQATAGLSPGASGSASPAATRP